MVDGLSATAVLNRFSAPADSFGSLDPESVAALISASSDIALVVDSKGVIRDATFATDELSKEAYRDWVGKRWVDVVTVESRPKIEEILREASRRAATRWRQVNYPAAQGGPDIPIRHCAIKLDIDQRIVCVGRDLRAMAQLQQRLGEAQQAMEREYTRIRGAEKRYRLLFQMASEAVLIVDAANHRITEVNPAAAALVGVDVKRLLGQDFGELFDEGSRQAAMSFVAAARVAPRIDNVHVQLKRDRNAILLSGSMFRQESGAQLLVLLSRLGAAGGALSVEKSRLLDTVEKSPDAVVVTEPNGRVLSANPAFLDLVQATSEEQVRGESIERWLGGPGVDVDVLFATLRAHGVARHFSTILRGEFGGSEDVEISAVSIPSGVDPCFGLSIRTSKWRGGPEKLGGRELPRTVEQFTGLVGRVPLKNLVRETTDLIERLCIEAALELTRDNRASAAEMLGLSRQGLYAKLRRYGLGDLDDAEGETN